MMAMRLGDKAFHYHSNCKTPGIAGVMEICKEAYPDYTAWDPSHPYYDAKSDKSSPRWFMVDVAFSRRLRRFIPLTELKPYKEGNKELSEMVLLKRGRLSVTPVSKAEWDFIMQLEKQDAS